MAYSSSRGPSRGSSRGGGGQATVAYAVAGVIVVLVVVVFMVVSNKGKPKQPSVPTAPPPKEAPVVAPPTKPAEKPYPPVPEARRADADKIASDAVSVKSKGQALYKEANEAKKAGDTVKWQSKLKEMRSILESLKDQWNEFVSTMPTSKDYDTEEVAKHYFPKQSGQVQDALKLLAASKSDER